MFGAVRLTKDPDFDKYKYYGYGIGFDRRGSFSFRGGWFGGNVIICGVDVSSSIHIEIRDNRYFNPWWGSCTRIRWTFIDCRQNNIQLISPWLKWNCVWAYIIMEQIVFYLLIVQRFANVK